MNCKKGQIVMVVREDGSPRARACIGGVTKTLRARTMDSGSPGWEVEPFRVQWTEGGQGYSGDCVGIADHLLMPVRGEPTLGERIAHVVERIKDRFAKRTAPKAKDATRKPQKVEA